MNQLPREYDQNIEGDENSTVQADNSKVVQGNNNHIDHSQDKIDVTINVIKPQSNIQSSEIAQKNISNNSQETKDIEKEQTEIHFFISGTLKNKRSKTTLKQLEQHLQKIANDLLLTIDDIYEGSLKLTLQGSQHGLEQLEVLFKSGELRELFGVPIKDISFTKPDKQKLTITIAGNISDTDVVKLRAVVTGADEKELLIRKIRINQGKKQLNFEEADFGEANLWGADLRGANLKGAKLWGVLTEADLRGADLRGADLWGADLRVANLREADLREADFRGADLSLANLREVKLRGANLRNTQLRKTLFSSNSIGMTEELKQDLISRGAIFEDSLEDPKILTPVGR